MLKNCLVLAALAATCTGYSASAEQILPGVWRIRLGTPERLTPLTYRSSPVRRQGFASLPSNVHIPLDPQAIVFRRSARGCTVELPREDSEKFYGLGLSTSTFDLAGRKAWVVPSDHPEETTNESHAPEPFYISSRGYGVYFDTARYAALSFGNYWPKDGHKAGVLADIPGSGGVDVYLFAGPTALAAVQRYNLFGGGGPVPPLWGLGIAYRGKGDSSAGDILRLAKSFRDTDMPCDIFGVEPGWQTQTYSSSFLWNLQKFPDPKGFIDAMHAMDFRMSFWEHPFTNPKSPIYEALKPYSGSNLVWLGLVPDFATTQGRRIFVGMQDQALLSKGVDSLKIDEVDNQPFKPDPWSFPDFSQFPSGLDGEQMHSLFGTLEQQALWTPFQEKNLRTWGLVRNSGALASALPYTVYSDSYDHRCYVRGLAKSGFGSHMWTPEVRDAKSVADLVRRIQTVIFSPYAMVNCWYMKTPPWLQIDADKGNAGIEMPEADEATRLVRSAFKLRMSLVPYLYSSFNMYHQTGLPPIRALNLDYPTDEAAADIDDQFMFGPSMMVAPMVDGASKRMVYFPKGDWYDFFTGERISGGRRIEIAKSLDQIPLYVKSGALLPVAEPINHLSKDTVFKLHMRSYGDTLGHFTLFSDDGETNDFEQGKQRRVELSWHSVSQSGKFDRARYEVADWTQIR